MVQPLEYLGTNTYKIGCSSKNDMLRCKNGYKRGTIYMVIMQSLNPFEVEAEIIATFNRDFTLVAGNEYFAGDEIEMRNKLCNIVLNFDHSKVPAAPAARVKRGGKVRLVDEVPAGAAAAPEIESYADFVKNNSDIFNEKYSENNFLVDSELLRGWLKNKCKHEYDNTIKSKYLINIDYIVKKPEEKRQHGGHNKQIFMLTPNTVKDICIMSRSPYSNKILNFFVEFEKQLLSQNI